MNKSTDIAQIEAMLYALSPDCKHVAVDEQERRFSRNLEVGFLRLEGKTYTEIAAIIGRTAPRASQIAWALSGVFVPDHRQKHERSLYHRWPKYSRPHYERESRQGRRVRKMREYIRKWGNRA